MEFLQLSSPVCIGPDRRLISNCVEGCNEISVYLLIHSSKWLLLRSLKARWNSTRARSNWPAAYKAWAIVFLLFLLMLLILLCFWSCSCLFFCPCFCSCHCACFCLCFYPTHTLPRASLAWIDSWTLFRPARAGDEAHSSFESFGSFGSFGLFDQMRIGD